MKRMVFELKDALCNMAFPEARINNRKELLLILLESCRYMMYNLQVPNADCKFMLIVDDMNRLFFCKEKKMFSIAFPFHVHVNDADLSLDYNQIKIDSQIISQICQILESEEYDSESALDFVTPIADIQERSNKDFWIILKHLLTYEIGYIRYDDDLEHFKEASRVGYPKRHPRYHFDINLSSHSVYKVGLGNKISPDKFVEFLDDTKDRWVVK